MSSLTTTFLLLLINVWCYAQEKEEANPRIKMSSPKQHKQIGVVDSSALSRIIDKPTPVDNMPILDPVGNFAMRMYRADTTLIYKMPIKGLGQNNLKRTDNK